MLGANYRDAIAEPARTAPVRKSITHCDKVTAARTLTLTQSTAEYAGDIDWVKRNRRWQGVFVFHQLGTLEYFTGARSQSTSMDKLGRSAWLSTGFCVVVRFSGAGQPKGIYLIYDTFPENDDGDRVEIESGNTWGRLVPDAALQFSCAKVRATLKGA